MNYLDVYRMTKTAADATTGFANRDAARDIIHAKETNWGTGAIKNPKSSAFGPYQMTKGTYSDTIKRHPDLAYSIGPDPKNNYAPLRIDYTHSNLSNMDYATRVVNAHIDDLASDLRGVFKREPTIQEVLAAYYGGVAGSTNPKSKYYADAQQYATDATSYQWYKNQRYKKIPQWVLDNDPLAKQLASK